MVTATPVHGQQPKAYRIGVLIPGDLWYEAIDGLKVGLKQLAFEEGKHFVLELRNSKGDLKVAAEAAKNLEHEKVDLLVCRRPIAGRNMWKMAGS